MKRAGMDVRRGRKCTAKEGLISILDVTNFA
jgi:hypothetical protein